VRSTRSSSRLSVSESLVPALQTDSSAVEANVSLAFINFSIGFNSGPLPLIAAATEKVSDLVEFVHREAGRLVGAVHGFMGDQVILSWNAASRAVQCEAKAARMAARLQDYGRATGLTLYGAVMSGRARVQLAGREKHRALTTGAEWVSQRRAPINNVGRRLRSIVIDFATKNAATFAVQVRAAAGIEVPATDDANQQPVRLALYEVVSEANDDDANEEWMYVLQGREAKSEAALKLLTLEAWSRRGDIDDDSVELMTTLLHTPEV
jgi:hypothetical protein